MGMRGVGVTAVVAIAGWTACSVLDAPDGPVPTYCFDQAADGKDPPSLWTELKPAGAPAARSNASFVLDEANDRAILFGGNTDNDNLLGDVWVLSAATDIGGGATWTKLEPTGTPPSARHGQLAGYDAKDNRLIVYGGGAGSILNDTFVLENANGLGGAAKWTKLTTTNDGPARTYAAGGYDEKSNALYVFGGFSGPTASDELWMLSNASGLDTTPSTWTKLSPSMHPSARIMSGVGFDATSDTMLLVGGAPDFTENAPQFDDAWSLAPLSTDARSFSLLGASPKPIGRMGASLVVDPKTHRAVIYGGLTSAGLVTSTWVLATDGSPRYARYDTGKAPAERLAHAAVYSAKANRMVVFGGTTFNGVQLGDTWVLDHANGDPPAPVTKIVINSSDKVCATKTVEVYPSCFDAAGNQIGCALVVTPDDPKLPTGGAFTPPNPGTLTVTICTLDKSVCETKVIDVTDPPAPGSSSSSGGSSSGGSTSSSGSTDCALCQTNADCDGVAKRHNVAGAACGTDHLCHACYEEVGSGTGTRRCIDCTGGCGAATCMNGICAFEGDGAKTCE